MAAASASGGSAASRSAPTRTIQASGGEIGMPGDSGSVWLAAEKEGKAPAIMLGLHFAGEESGDPNEHAMACYAHAVFKKLEVGLASPPSVELSRRRGIGYDPGFLGADVPVPKATGRVLADLLVVDGSPVIDHTHFSLVMSRERKLARWVAWNVDGAELKAFGRSGLDSCRIR